MKIKMRFDESNKVHTRFTIFEDGANCGQLCMTTQGAASLCQILMLAKQTFGKGIDDFVSSGHFYVEEEDDDEL